MHRVVVDTNLFIDWFNDGRHDAVLFQRGAVKYLSAVVMMELYAGVSSSADRRLLDRLTRTFVTLDRVLLPTRRVYEEAGHVLRAMQALRGYTVPAIRSLTNDVLIALSARSIGATVVTQNARDFLAIQSIRRFKLAAILSTQPRRPRAGRERR